MTFTGLKEAEATIASQTDGWHVALDNRPTYAAKVGVIISIFAIVEDYAPQLLARLTGLSEKDARAILGTFRAFSNRIDLLKAICKQRGNQTPDSIAGRYYIALLNEANKLRNKYAHALYSATKHSVILKTYSSDYNRGVETIDQTEDVFQADIVKLRRIVCELHALIHRNEVPKALHKQLRKLGR